MTELTIASAWRQVDHRRDSHPERGVILHIPRPDGSGHAVCSADLRHATAVTPEGAAVGRTCSICERSALARR